MTNTLYRQQPAPLELDPATELLMRALDNERRTLRGRVAFIEEKQAQAKIGHYPTVLASIDQERQVLCRRIAFADTILNPTRTASREAELQAQIDELRREMAMLKQQLAL